MNKCLVLKLAASVEDTEGLLKIGEKEFAVFSSSNHEVGYTLKYANVKTRQMRIVGDATFKNDTKVLTVDGTGGNFSVKSTGNYTLYIPDKYNLVEFVNINNLYNYFTLDGIEYFLSLKKIAINNNDSALLAEDFCKSKTLEYISVRNANIIGSIEDFAQVPSLVELDISGCKKLSYTWSSPTLRSNSMPIIGLISNVEFDSQSSVDNFLINMANCTVSTSSYASKVITIVTKRTSASDTAVELLQNLGYTVNVELATI